MADTDKLDDRQLVTRIYERQEVIRESQKQIIVDIRELRHDLDMKLRDMARDLEERYVTKDAFEPVKRVIYALVSLILLGVVGALIESLLH